jgi:hypothetical protein
MKVATGVSLLVVVLSTQRFSNVEAFASHFDHGRRSTSRAFSPLMDPSHLPDLPNQIQSLHDAFSSISLADLDADALTSDAASAVSNAFGTASDAVQAVDPSGAVAESAAKSGNGWFGFLTGPTMTVLQYIHYALVAVGVSSDSWGVSIITLTILIKLLTFPLTKAQLESTNKMQVCNAQCCASSIRKRAYLRTTTTTVGLKFERSRTRNTIPSHLSSFISEKLVPVGLVTNYQRNSGKIPE